ncbi:MAG: S1 RNA-binding domain-containing protein [Synergistes sp.]|nr:S1 RNA-binding domain-containing protein [Synergistes sp.]
MAENAAAKQTVSVGQTVNGTVELIAPYGAFVRLETGQKSMIHISELSHSYVKRVEDMLELGQKITAKVIKIDEKGRIDISLKALQVREVRPPARREEDFEKKLNSFLKFSDEKIADLNTKNKGSRGNTGKRRTGGTGNKK